MRALCRAICLIALFVASSDQESNQETGASKQLAAPLPYTHLLTDLNRTRRYLYAQRYSIGRQRPGHLKKPYSQAAGRYRSRYCSNGAWFDLVIRFSYQLICRLICRPSLFRVCRPSSKSWVNAGVE
jgi:hypothetical protein